MLWRTPIYKFRVPISPESEYLYEILFDVTGSAPPFLEVLDTMRGVWEELLQSQEGKKSKAVLDFGAAKFRNTLYFLENGKDVSAVEFQELPDKSEDAKKNLERCKENSNFKHLIFPYPFIEDKEKFDLVLLVNVLPVMPVFAERLMVLDLLYDKVNEDRYVLWYTQREGSYKKVREEGKNNFSDGLWMGTNKKFKTFYRYQLYGFHFVRKLRAIGNDALLFQKTPYNLFHRVVTPKKILQAIRLDESITEPSSVKFKKVKISKENKVIDPNPFKLTLEQLYAEVLRSIPPGSQYAEKYHRVVSLIIYRIFRGSLRNMEIKPDIFKGLKVLDTIYSNAGGFFEHVSKTFKIECPYILLEAKNYSFDLENPEFDQIAGRLFDDLGKLGLLVCRSIEDQEAAKAHCESFLTDNRKHVIMLTDEDLLHLLDLKADSDTDGINDYMDRKMRILKFRSKK